MTSRKACFIKTLGCLLFAAILFVAAGGSGWAAEPAESKVKELMPAAGGALVHAGQKDWSEVAKELEQFEAKWKAPQAPTSALADGVTTALVEAKQALGEAQAKPDQAYQAVSKLTKAVDAFASAQEAAGTKGDGKAAAKSLLPVLQQCLDAIGQNQLPKARSEYKRFDAQWSKAEGAIRSDNAGAYGEIETKLSLARIALQAEPPKAEVCGGGRLGFDEDDRGLCERQIGGCGFRGRAALRCGCAAAASGCAGCRAGRTICVGGGADAGVHPDVAVGGRRGTDAGSRGLHED
ncbi:hypothetical protein LJK88_05735 [Paenibacillus sp. P26]|nr:hypothetical protein LJK88_05735 [Paenibacillus sp. P26]